MRSLWFRKTFARLFKLLQIKEGWPHFCWKPILQNVWIIWSPLLHFNFKRFKDPNSLSFIIFQCILCDSGVSFPDFWNFIKLKRGDLSSGENQISRKSELFGPPFWTEILNFSRFHILHHSLDLNAFCMIQQNLRQTFEISTN